ncbi:MAG TPA: hypothetical protein VFV87_03430 [Pirellulaceae bacterium]|nr:hypothetical protein [Pirellulaceae bacterium]
MRITVPSSVAAVGLLVLSFLSPGCGRPTLKSSGGYVLTYRLAQGETADGQDLARAMQHRLQAGDFPHASVRHTAGDALVVELPGANAPQVERAQKLLQNAGHLAFRIVADKQLDQKTAEAALAGNGLDAEADAAFAWVKCNAEALQGEDWMVTRDNPAGGQEILVLVGPDDVTGNELAKAVVARDSAARPCIQGSLRPIGAQKMSLLTGANIDRRLGIILDGELLTWPVIRSPIGQDLQITGNFTEDEVQRIVTILKSGTFPGRLNDEPESVQEVQPP